ncbi:MAG: hypothetical protein MUP15_04090 [Dehalococcoidia bacterium]|nr:hypothetical protein [Dehalococcoidia bacterium]
MSSKGPSNTATAPPDDSQADQERDALIASVAQRIVDKGLAAPAVFFLESSKPLSFLTSQAMIVFEPTAHALFDTTTYTRFQELLEDRENVERLIVSIERKEDERLTLIHEKKKRDREDRKQRKRAKVSSDE